jgi:hypothetical protein
MKLEICMFVRVVGNEHNMSLEDHGGDNFIVNVETCMFLHLLTSLPNHWLIRATFHSIIVLDSSLYMNQDIKISSVYIVYPASNCSYRPFVIFICYMCIVAMKR